MPELLDGDRQKVSQKGSASSKKCSPLVIALYEVLAGAYRSPVRTIADMNAAGCRIAAPAELGHYHRLSTFPRKLVPPAEPGRVCGGRAMSAGRHAAASGAYSLARNRPCPAQRCPLPWSLICG